MEWIIGWAILSIIVAFWAEKRGHSGPLTLLLALLLSPLIAALIEFVRGPNVKVVEKAAVARGDLRKCPACAELVKAEAKKCRYCGEALTPTT